MTETEMRDRMAELPAKRQIWLDYACGCRVWIHAPATYEEARDLQAQAAGRNCAACASEGKSQLTLTLDLPTAPSVKREVSCPSPFAESVVSTGSKGRQRKAGR